MSRFVRTGRSFSKKSKSVIVDNKDRIILMGISFLIAVILFCHVYYQENKTEVQNYLSEFTWYQTWDIIQKEQQIKERHGDDETLLPDTR